MTAPPPPPSPPDRSSGDPHHLPQAVPPDRAPIVWPAVFGLGALVLLWPLTSLTGVADAIGPAVRGIGVIALIGAAWIGVVGFSRLSRPVLTLTLTGLVGALYLAAAEVVASAAASGALSLFSLLALVDLAVGGALGGVLTGLVAAGVQRLRRVR